VYVSTELPDTFLLPLKKGLIVTPSVRIGPGAHHMQIDGTIQSDERFLQRLEAANQELCLRADAVGKIVESIVREIK
jgi:creatinine amidohydrolase/Fe(II)-dependent formamide hydrolase-like protein